MTDTKRRHKPLRLPGYDYRSLGGYFVTIRFDLRKEQYYPLLFEDLKELVVSTFEEIHRRHSEFVLDEWVLMPDHIHFICFIIDDGALGREDKSNKPLGLYIRQFKSKVSFEMNRKDGVHFAWRANFYEHIVRSEKAIFKIREYIQNNPLSLELKNEGLK